MRMTFYSFNPRSPEGGGRYGPQAGFLAIMTEWKGIKKNGQDLFLEGPIPDVPTFSA